MQLPERVTVYEVGPRDGFQNLARFVPTDSKIAFINALSAAGLPAIEATSFVSPQWVPQLADAREVMEGIERGQGIRYPVLVPNLTGLERALDTDVREIAVFTAASETFNRRNINATIDESIDRFRPVMARAASMGLRVRGYVSTAFGCPYQGDVDPGAVVRVTGDLFEVGCSEVSIGDTIGVADPAQVHSVVAQLQRHFDLGGIALHLHDTYGRGLANVVAGLEAGVRTFDSAAGGLGGCPYARGATGNLATEDLVAMLDQMNIRTGIDLTALVAATSALAASTGLRMPSRAFEALRAQQRALIPA
ncbi:MAG: hydroxymethylglutaryl-CoA lyase [Acidobacteria bacterium]|nr:hydroxymethylglutaryl-CoA lyase [Acidobacteriota bacterium]